MARWSKNTAQVRDNGFGGSRGGRKIEGAVIHHVAGTNGLNYVANWNARDSHPTYHVDKKGKQTGVVHPDRRPFSTAHTVDRVAVTFEVDNTSVGGNWPVSAAALETIIETCVDHAKQAGLKKFARNTPGKDQPGVFFIAWHSQYKATACPGPFLLSKIDYIISECNKRIGGGSPTPPKPAPKPTPQKGWEASDFGIGTNATKKQWGTIQEWLKKLNRYDGPVDKVPGPNTWKGIQATVAKYGYYKGPIDGDPFTNTAKSMQMYARDGGGYTGPIDGILGPNSWAGFVKRLSS